MITVLASIRVAKGQRSAFLDIFNANVPKVRNENGCIEYFPTVDVDSSIQIQNFDENIVTIVEKWQSLEALNTHLAAPHMLEYKEKVKELVEDVSLKVLQPA